MQASSLRGKPSAASAAEEQEWALKRDVCEFGDNFFRSWLKSGSQKPPCPRRLETPRKMGTNQTWASSVLASVEALKQPPPIDAIDCSHHSRPCS